MPGSPGWPFRSGTKAYPKARHLLVCAHAGGSNGYRLRLWQTELARLADDESISVTVCHFPPGTSKWNKIEHRLFSAISTNWKDHPLTSHEVVVNLIGATANRVGPIVKAQLDRGTYPTKIRVPNKDVDSLIKPHDFHGEWNYTLRPANNSRVSL